MSRKLLAIALLFSAGTAMGADLGRMFFTPAERAMLDNARKKSIRGEVISETKAAAPVPQNVSVTGMVRRSDGKSTIWVNNRPVTDRQTGAVKVAPTANDNRVKLTVPESGRSVDLKVGQSVEILSGTIEEGYARRTAPKPATSAPGTENTGAEKTTAVPAPAPVQSEGIALKRSTRVRNRDIQDDLRPDDGLERK